MKGMCCKCEIKKKSILFYENIGDGIKYICNDCLWEEEWVNEVIKKGKEQIELELRGFKMSKYPDGKCPICSKIFPRPNKWRTEIESFHVNGCELKEIESKIKKGLEPMEKYKIIEELKRISKISSFGAKEGNEYWDRMIECARIKELMEDEE